jgi:hypothetical protein
MSMNVELLSDTARAVLAEYDARLTLVGLTGSGEGPARVELLVTIAGCHESPCTLLLNVGRKNSVAFASELRRRLHEALDAHRRSPPAGPDEI